MCRLHGKHDIHIESADVATPSEGEVLVRMGAGGICGSDLHYYHDGGFGPIRVQEPIVLGHEVAGTVVELGAGVNGLAPGDKVAVNPSNPCGSCKFCNDGLFHHCLNMRFFGSAMRFPHEQGGFRDTMIVRAPQCVPVSGGTSLSQAACAEPLAVCLHAKSHAPALSGKRVLVTGAGPIGVLCAAVAAESGAAEIVVTDLQDLPLGVALKMGANQAINVATQPALMEPFCADKGYFDVAFECSAAAPAIQSAITALRPQGTLIQVGVTGTTPMPVNLLVSKEIRFIGTHRFDAEFAQAVEMIDAGRINVAPMITQTFPLEQAVAAFDMAGDRAVAVKVQLSFAAP